MLVEPTIKKNFPDDSRKIIEMKLPKTKLGKINVSVREYKQPDDVFITEVKDSRGNILGAETFSLTDDIYGYNIEVEEAKRGQQLGELLRLSSIIEMFENKINLFRIYSKAAAIYFHSKYKFEPDLSGISHRNMVVEEIMKNKSEEFISLAQKAEKLFEKIEATSNFDSDKQEVLTKEANELLKDYIQKVLETNKQKDFPFQMGFRMKLTKESIVENAEFFNELFKKHHINYQI